MIEQRDHEVHGGPPRSRPSVRGKGALAVAGTLLWPGIGHLIAGDRRRGIFWFAATLAVMVMFALACVFPALVPLLLVLLPVQILILLLACIGAYRSGHKSLMAMLTTPVKRYIAALLLLAIAIFLNPQGKLAYYLRDNWMQAYSMTNVSMSPTLKPNDWFLVHKRIGFGRWSVIVFHRPENPKALQVARVVGLPGEQVELRFGKVYIDGKPVSPPLGIGPYVDVMRLGHENGGLGNPLNLGSDEYYVLGDNSPLAYDSRYWKGGAPGHQPGAVPAASIVGAATWIYWPPSRWQRLK